MNSRFECTLPLLRVVQFGLRLPGGSLCFANCFECPLEQPACAQFCCGNSFRDLSQSGLALAAQCILLRLITLGEGGKVQTVRGRKGRVERRADYKLGCFLCHDAVVRAGAVEHIHQIEMSGLMQLGRFLQPDDALTCEPCKLNHEFKQHRRDRPQMGRIHIEARGSHYQVLWIRRFHDQDAAWLQCTQGLRNQFLYRVERDVLNQVEGRDQCKTGIRLGAQGGDGILGLHVEATVAASFQHAFVQIHTGRHETRFTQQLEPLAAATAQIEGRRRARCCQWHQERQVGCKARFDQLARAAMTVFKCPVKRIAHLVISTVGSSQLVPTKTFLFMFMTMNRNARSRHS